MGYILFDIGGTNTRIAFTEDCKQFEEPIIFKTQSDFNEAIDGMKKYAKKVSNGRKIEMAIGGVPGILNKEKTNLVISPNLEKWIEEPLMKTLEEKLGCKVHLENDADLVGLGEAVYGAGKESKIVAYLTISTGVGGSRIVNQEIDKNIFGFEPGHQIINIEKGEREDRLSFKTLENYIGGRIIEKKMGMKSQEIKNERFWMSTAKYLAVGLNNVIVFWSPNVIVLGGGVMLNHINLDVVKKELSSLMSGYKFLPELKLAKLGDFGGLYGAMHLAGVIIK